MLVSPETQSSQIEEEGAVEQKNEGLKIDKQKHSFYNLVSCLSCNKPRTNKSKSVLERGKKLKAKTGGTSHCLKKKNRRAAVLFSGPVD